MLQQDVLRDSFHFLGRNTLDRCCYVTRQWKVLIYADSAKTLAIRIVEVAQIKYSHRSPRVECNIALKPIEDATSVDYRSLKGGASFEILALLRNTSVKKLWLRNDSAGGSFWLITLLRQLENCTMADGEPFIMSKGMSSLAWSCSDVLRTALDVLGAQTFVLDMPSEDLEGSFGAGVLATAADMNLQRLHLYLESNGGSPVNNWLSSLPHLASCKRFSVFYGGNLFDDRVFSNIVSDVVEMFLSDPKCMPQVLVLGLAHSLHVHVGVVLPDLVEGFDVQWHLDGGTELPSSDAAVSQGADRHAQSKADGAIVDHQIAQRPHSDVDLTTSGRAYYCRRAATATELLICFFDDVHGYAKIEFHRCTTRVHEILEAVRSSVAFDQP